MKNSGVEWIGEIPDDWEISKTKYLTKLYTGNSIKDEEKNLYEDKADAVPYISSKDINATFSTTNYENGMYVKHSDNSFVRAPAGSTLMCIEGGSAGKKKTFLNQEVCFVNKLCCFSPIKIDNKFLFYCLNSPNYEEEFRFNISGMIGGVSVGKLNQFILPKPPKETQQRIASYLDKKCSKIEETIQNQQQVIEKLKAYKQSLITEAVTGKIKIQNGKVCGKYESYKDSGVEWIGKIPSKWISTRVGHLYKSMLGKMVCPNQLTEEHSLQKYLCAMNVHFDGVDLSEIKEMWFTPNEMNQYQVRNGDLLVVEGGAGAGGASIVYGLSENDKIFIQNSIHLVKPVKTNYLPKYLYYWIYSLVKQNYIDYTCNKATIPHFTKEKLEGMPIAISDKITQQEIIVYLDKKCTVIDTAIEQKQKLIEKLTEYKKSLIYECVTGKKEI